MAEALFETNEQNYSDGYSDFQKEVVAFISDRAEYMEPSLFPREAFSDAGVFVDTVTKGSDLMVDMAQKNHWENPEDVMQYLADNAEEICGVLDSAGKLDGIAERIEENPQQVMINAYVEAAKDLCSVTPFFFNQGIRKEQSANRLEQDDIKAICANLNGEIYDRAPGVIKFRGVENGKPYTAEYDMKKAMDVVDNYFGQTVGNETEVEKVLMEAVKRVGRDFRVMGPAEAYNDFNLHVTRLAKDLERGKSNFSSIVKEWQKEVNRCFKSGRDMELGATKGKVTLRTKTLEQDNEHTRGSR